MLIMIGSGSMASIGISIPNLVGGAVEGILEKNPENYRSIVPGPQGIQGIAGRNVHHVIHDRSILPDGTIIPGVARGNGLETEILPGITGNKDIYEAYADEEELSNVGEITVTNGSGAYEYAVTGGFVGSEEDLSEALGHILTVVDEMSTLEADVTDAIDKARQWATEDEDVEVETDEYSSLHWAAKAKNDTLNALAVADAKVNTSDIVDDVVSIDTDKPLSANQGKLLKDAIDTINTLLSSDDTTLDELQEVVNYIKANRDDLGTLTLDNIAETNTNKWFTSDDNDKLDGIEAGATVDQTDDEIRTAYNNTYVQKSGSNYLDTATSIDNETEKLDAQIKVNEDKLTELSSTTEW